MKMYVKYKNFVVSSLLMTAVLFSGSASAGLINGDFSDGLDGWGGDVVYYDPLTGIETNWLVDVDFNNFVENFSTGANSVTLNTSVDNDANEYWGVYLFQEFMVDAHSSMLSIDFATVSDYAFVTLLDGNGDLYHDFMNDGLSVDISGLAGSFVWLEFGVEDADFVLDDYLTVSNISISSVSVPEPASLFLLSIALIAISRKSMTPQTTNKI